MNGEAGLLGAAATAPEAQPSPSYCVTQHPLPSPTLPAWLQPAAPCSPSRSRRPSSIVSCRARRGLSAPGDASLCSRSAGTLGRAAACGHPIRLCQGRPGAETHRAVTGVRGQQDPSIVQGWAWPAAQGAGIVPGSRAQRQQQLWRAPGLPALRRGAHGAGRSPAPLCFPGLGRL